MSAKEEFIEIYRENIRRDGADALLDYLEHKSDFFTAPASARFHGAYAGGLCEHSVNVYHCLTAYLERERVKELYGLEYPAESAALVSLLHDVCKTGCYRQGSRNVKAPTASGRRCPPFSTRTPCPTATGRRASTSSPASCASPGRRPWPSAGTWASPVQKIQEPWGRLCKNTLWPSPWLPPIWKPATSWRENTEPVKTPPYSVRSRLEHGRRIFFYQASV